MIGGKQLVQALDNAESIVVITDNLGVISFVNKTFEKVYGYSRQEAIGKTPSVLKSGYHSRAFYQDLWQDLNSGKSWHGDFINRGKNGELIIEKASISPILSDDGSKTIGFIAVKEDISIQKKLREQLQMREQLFEKLFENSPVGILMMTKMYENGRVTDLKISKVNPRGFEILNHPDLVGRSLRETIEDPDLIDRLLGGRDSGSEGLEWRHEDSGRTFRLMWFQILPGQECLLISDVSKQKEMEQQLLKSEDYLLRLNHTKDKFFGILAHDLKNPFQVIIGFTSLLHENIENYTAAEMKEMVRQISSASETTYMLLEDLLTWSKSQLGQLTPYPGKCDAQQLVNKAFQQVDGLANKKRIELINEIPESLYCTADPDMMEFVLRNLIHNGIKFTHQGGRVRCWASLSNGDIRIHVEDSGIGIQESKLKSLFSLDAFLSTPGTDDETGSGLGLILIHEMVQLNQGSIEVKSTPHKGSCFTVFLPASHN